MLIHAWIQIQQLLEKEPLQRKNFFNKMSFEKFIEWRLRNDMEIKLWKLSACTKRKFYCFEEFTEVLVFFV